MNTESTNAARRTVCYLDFSRQQRNTAGNKAPDDVARLCAEAGYRRVELPAFPMERSFLYQRLWLLTVCPLSWLKLARQIPDGSVLVYQHPMYGKPVVRRMLPWLKRKRSLRLIALVHDLESLRGGIAGVVKQRRHEDRAMDQDLLREMDAIICHNGHMRNYLVEQGLEAERITELGIFDYLTECDRRQPAKGETPSVAIAGNLAPTKCAYIYDIFSHGANPDLTVHLYGNNFDPSSAAPGLKHHGSFKPEELPDHLQGDFGLVWDGTSAETCAGNTGNYLRYNNPHKTSLYLSSNMPVVVWKEAAIADFVLRSGVGIAVGSLWELSDAIRAITPEAYDEMCARAARVGASLRRGDYFRAAIGRCLSDLR